MTQNEDHRRHCSLFSIERQFPKLEVSGSISLCLHTSANSNFAPLLQRFRTDFEAWDSVRVQLKGPITLYIRLVFGEHRRVKHLALCSVTTSLGNWTAIENKDASRLWCSFRITKNPTISLPPFNSCLNAAEMRQNFSKIF